MSSTLTRESGKPGAPPAPGRGSWLIRDEDRHVAPARIAGTELAVAVVAPAVGFATGRDSARVVATGKDRGEDLSRVDRKRGVTAWRDRALRRGRARLGGRRIIKKKSVLSPTMRRVAGPDTACVLRYRTQRQNDDTARDRMREKGVDR